MDPLRWSVSVVTAISISCGSLNCSQSSKDTELPDSGKESRGPQEKGMKGAGSAGMGKLRGEQGEEFAGPDLTDEALAARIVAQSKLLGSAELFEDAQGRPIIPVWKPEEKDIASDEEDDGSILDRLPGSSGIAADGQLGGENQVNGNALGLYVPLQQSSSTLSNFYNALRQLEEQPIDEEGKPRKVRILAYGASHTQADIFTDYMREYLQERFGDAGHGFVSPVRVNRWYRHIDVAIESSKGWKVEHAQKHDARGDGFYGLLGMSGSSKNRRDYARIRPNFRRLSDRDSNSQDVSFQYEVSYFGHPKSGHFHLFADRNQFVSVRTRNRNPGIQFYDFTPPPEHSTLEFRPKGNGEVRLFGVIIERDRPGIVLDTLGISGTRITNHLVWDETIWRTSVQRRNPALYILAYGTNEATDIDQPVSDYEQKLRTVVQRFRDTLPQASCLIVGPGDFSIKIDEDNWKSHPKVEDIAKIQEKVAKELDCAFWDALAFMGGKGSIMIWANSYPQMASKDHIHLTRRGYVRMGMALTDALMDGYEVQ